MPTILFHGLGGRSLLPLLPPREERAGERRFLYGYCPSLRPSPRSFLEGGERKRERQLAQPKKIHRPIEFCEGLLIVRSI
jgi:hypothetical protein